MWKLLNFSQSHLVIVTVSKSLVSFTNALFLLAHVYVPSLPVWCACLLLQLGWSRGAMISLGCWKQCELIRDCSKESSAAITGHHGCREHEPQCWHSWGTRWKAILPCWSGQWRQGCNGLTIQNPELPFIKANFYCSQPLASCFF